ncbi:MAG: SGNH/GDSL hydrolase family protein [Kiritimatiellae bacterium]|nr:SGNH/GDSL hydrolase family protein [Kiritimatiellia bacterium]
MNHKRWLTWTAVAAMVFGASAVASSGFLEDSANEPAKKSSGLPEILLIGDSIRQLYCPYVAEALRGKVEVKWPKENCQNTQFVLTSLSRWRGLVASPKVVQFNCGHWDAAHWDGDDEPLTSVEEYTRNIRKIIHRLRRYWPDAKIVFATTTTMNPSGKQGRNKRTTESIRAYNAAAVKVAREEGVAVNDLFAVVEKWPASDYKDYCHYNKAASKRLGSIVAERLAKETGL